LRIIKICMNRVISRVMYRDSIEKKRKSYPQM